MPSTRATCRRTSAFNAAVSSSGAHLVGPHREARQRVRAEGIADGDVRRIAAPGDEHPADARHVVARVKRVPMAGEKALNPGGKTHGAVGRRHADIAEI